MKSEGTKIWFEQYSNISPEARIGKNCVIHSHVWIGPNVTIGDRCKIEAFSFLPPGVTLEDDVFVGPGVIFTNDKYPPSGGKDWLETRVRKGASIGAGAVVLPGITIHENALVGAGAVVTKDVPTHAIVYGNPAQVKGERTTK